ncbi:phosphoribosylanthranilate isomerase [Castellaniella sp.]|uniref:phosphoribosylanthranilate isomerase n=1 Tax=Castellaniella sp. TaxID=1955812 RepID=UPI00355CFAAC
MNDRTRIKICGLTRASDLQAAIRCGVDAIGLVFHPSSPRHLDTQAAARLRAQVPAFVTTVALFANAQAADVQAVADTLRPDILQFHGEEPEAFCTSFGLPYIKAFRVGAPGQAGAAELAGTCSAYTSASAWLFDSYSPAYGGSGLKFDLALLSDVVVMPGARPVVLSGGLTADTVAAGLAACRPYAVDVSSGVESAPGLKDAHKMHQFVQAVVQADLQSRLSSSRTFRDHPLQSPRSSS